MSRQYGEQHRFSSKGTIVCEGHKGTKKEKASTYLIKNPTPHKETS